MRMVFRGIVLVAFLVSVGVLPACAQFFFDEHPMVGQKAPEFELKNLNSMMDKFSQLSSGKNTILFFWATWCPHCRAQLKELNHKVTQLTAEGINLILVDLGEDAGTVQRYLTKNKMSFQVLLDEESEVSEQYRVFGIPTFIFVDKSGMIRGVENYLPDGYKKLFLNETIKK